MKNPLIKPEAPFFFTASGGTTKFLRDLCELLFKCLSAKS
jgi:hypothetical protein